MKDPRKRHRLIHMTIRDPDCPDFDVDHMIETYSRWRVTAFSFFAAGYITTYPSNLPFQRLSPGMEKRDLTGEIIEKAHAADMLAIPMIDLGEIPVEVAEEYPEWPGRDSDGNLYFKTDTIVSSCPNGGYVRDASRRMVAELAERYDLDGMKFGGASQQMPGAVCYCDNCRRVYREDTGRDLPPDDDLGARDYQEYLLWRDRIKERTVRYLVQMVHEVADVPVVGNSVWQLGNGKDIRDLARSQDWVQVEVQTRYGPMDDSAPVIWHRLKFATETSRYMSLLSTAPPWVVTSYFLAWPWRRVAVPYNEQKLVLAQMAANGVSPMVNLSGGPPKVHEDPRGFQAIEETYNFIADHPEVFEDEASAARVALVYSEGCSALAKKIERDNESYVFGLQSTENALDEAHIPYDIVSADDLSRLDGSRYDVIVLPSASVLSAEAVSAITNLHSAGVGIVAWGDPGRFDASGAPREAVPLASLLGVRSIAAAGGLIEAAGPVGRAQAYLRHTGDEPICDGIESPLLPASGPWWRVEPLDAAQAVVSRGPAFRVFPEGLSYSEDEGREPMVLTQTPEKGGRVVYMAFDVGHCAGRTAHPDLARLLTNSLDFAARSPRPVRLDGAPDVLLSLRRKPGRLFVHLVNTTGRQRFLTSFTPVRELVLRISEDLSPRSARLVGRDLSLPVGSEAPATVVVPELVDYDVVELTL